MRNLSLLTLSLAVVTGAAAQEFREVRLYDCLHTAVAPIIDGDLSDAAYQNAPIMGDFVVQYTKKRTLARVATQARIVYDDQALYLSILCHEPNMDKLRANCLEYDGSIWWDDSIEIYIEPGYAHDNYLKFAFSVNGTRHDAKAEPTPTGFQVNPAWGAGAEWRVAIARQEASWTAEVRLPFADMDAPPPQPGDLWSFQLVRFRRAGETEYSEWSPGGNYNSPHNFGYLTFGGALAAFERLITEKVAKGMGTVVRIDGSRGRIMFSDYRSLLDPHIQQARTTIATVRQKLEPLAEYMDKAVVKSLTDSIEALSQAIEEASAEEPGPVSILHLDEALRALSDVEWHLRLAELNSQLDQ